MLKKQKKKTDIFVHFNQNQIKKTVFDKISARLQKFDQFLKISGGCFGERSLADQEVHQKEGVHSDALCGQNVLLRVVSDHQAMLGADVHFFRDLRVVSGIRLAEGGIFIVCDQIEAVGRNLCPGEPGAYGDGGENGAGGEDDLVGLLSCDVDRLLREQGREGDLCGLMEFVFVKGIKFGNVAVDAFTENLGEDLPEDLGIRLLAVVFEHGARSFPERGDQEVLVVAVGSHFLCEQTEIGFDEKIVVHRQQGAVEIK